MEGAAYVAIAPGKLRTTAPDVTSITSRVLEVPSTALDSTARISPATATGAITYPGVTCFQAMAPVAASNAISDPGSPCGVFPPAAYSLPYAKAGVEMLPHPPVGSPPTVGSAGSTIAIWYF